MGQTLERVEVHDHRQFKGTSRTSSAASPVCGCEPEEVLAGRKAFEEAETQCSEVLRDDPKRAGVYAARASIRKQRGDLKGADVDLLNALRFGGPDADLLFERGVILDELGRGTEAEAILTEALALQPAHAGALNSRGIVQMRRGDLAAAKVDLDAAVRLAPDWELPYANRANVQFMLGEVNAARDDCTRAIELITLSRRAEQRALLIQLHRNRAAALEELGEPSGAEADRKIADQLDHKPS